MIIETIRATVLRMSVTCVGMIQLCYCYLCIFGLLKKYHARVNFSKVTTRIAEEYNRVSGRDFFMLVHHTHAPVGGGESL